MLKTTKLRNYPKRLINGNYPEQVKPCHVSMHIPLRNMNRPALRNNSKVCQPFPLLVRVDLFEVVVSNHSSLYISSILNRYRSHKGAE